MRGGGHLRLNGRQLVHRVRRQNIVWHFGCLGILFPLAKPCVLQRRLARSQQRFGVSRLLNVRLAVQRGQMDFLQTGRLPRGAKLSKLQGRRQL